MAGKSKNGRKKGKKKTVNGRVGKFIDNFINTDNATQSAIDAGYSKNGANRTASRLLTKVDVQAEIAKRRQEIAKRNGVTADKVINEIAKIAFSNSEDYFEWGRQTVELSDGLVIERGVAILKTPDQLTRDHKACIQSIEETQHGIKLKLYSKDKALESLKQYFGVNNEAEIKKALAIREGSKPGDGSAASNLEERIKEKMKANGFDD
jgi:phage terminase small subunit